MLPIEPLGTKQVRWWYWNLLVVKLAAFSREWENFLRNRPSIQQIHRLFLIEPLRLYNRWWYWTFSHDLSCPISVPYYIKRWNMLRLWTQVRSNLYSASLSKIMISGSDVHTSKLMHITLRISVCHNHKGACTHLSSCATRLQPDQHKTSEVNDFHEAREYPIY